MQNPPETDIPSPDVDKIPSGAWVTLIVGLVLLLCCSGLMLFVYVDNRGQEDSILKSIHARSKSYDESYYGLHLEYPGDWVSRTSPPGYDAYLMVFASSQDVIDDLVVAPTDGAALVINQTSQKRSELPSSVVGMQGVLEYGLKSEDRNLTPLETPRFFHIGDYPAASGVYLYRTNGFNASDRWVFDQGPVGGNTVLYFTVVVRDETMIYFIGACPPDQWLEYRPVFEKIIDSVRLTPVQ